MTMPTTPPHWLPSALLLRHAVPGSALRLTWCSVLPRSRRASFSKSQGLIADGFHTLSDLIADFVVLAANHHSQKEADAEHPYGHQRYENAASLVLGLLLLAVGIGMLWTAFTRLEAPHNIPTAPGCPVGCPGRPDRQGNPVPLHAGSGQTRQVEHARCQRLACPL